MRGQALSLTNVVESEGRLVVSQSNGAALRNLRNALIPFVLGVPSLIFFFAEFPNFGGAWGTAGSTDTTSTPPLGIILFFCLPLVVQLIYAVNRFFGKETFIFDRNEGVFIRNGFTVGPLSDIRAVTVQVTASNGQYVMFRLILELPRCQTVTIVRTHDVPANGEFHLSRNGFGDPNKRFAVFMPWLDYDKQKLVPFLPPEIEKLRHTITSYIGTQTVC